MADNIITFMLEGNLTLQDFTKGLQRFQALIQVLTTEVSGKNAVSWRLEDLSPGSAIIRARGESKRRDFDPVLPVVYAYGNIGQALMEHQPIPFPFRVQAKAERITDLIGGSIDAVRFETDYTDALIKNKPSEDAPPVRIVYSQGAVKGRVQTLTSRRGHRFTLYDSLFDRPISCYLREAQEDVMRDAWGKRVIVAGQLGRSSDDRRVLAVRNITHVEILDDVPPGSYTQARGALRGLTEDLPAELLVRRLRDVD